MHSAIRPSTPADAAAITRLLTEAGLQPNSRPQDLWWKYWQPRADWPGPRSFVLTRGDELIAHAAIVPGWCDYQGQRMSVIHVVDWAARGGVPGAGAMLMKHMGHQAQALLAIGGSMRTREVLPYLGFRAAGTATGYVRSLGPHRFLRVVRSRNWRLVPRLLRSALWSAYIPAVGKHGWSAREIQREAAASVAEVLPRPETDGSNVLGRSTGQLQYMLECPILPIRLFGVERGGHLGGYFLLAYAPGQVRIADCWMESGARIDWQAMLICAVEQARLDPSSAEVAVIASDPAFSAALTSCGFHPRFGLPVQLRLPNGGAVPASPLGVRMLDNDAAYYYEPGSILWA